MRTFETWSTTNFKIGLDLWWNGYIHLENDRSSDGFESSIIMCGQYANACACDEAKWFHNMHACWIGRVAENCELKLKITAFLRVKQRRREKNEFRFCVFFMHFNGVCVCVCGRELLSLNHSNSKHSAEILNIFTALCHCLLKRIHCVNLKLMQIWTVSFSVFFCFIVVHFSIFKKNI